VLTVSPGAFVVGKSLVEARLRKEHGLTVVAVQRDGRTYINPDPGWVFAAGDLAHVFGEQDVILEKVGLFTAAADGA
jgi:CPA2 family monovalent cation:H+ antiporter-2